jgi:ABC-type nitrate/sulfonate/bicarbonate transport system permease component
LKPGEVITWIKIEPFRFPLGQIVFSSLAGVGLAILLALSIGILLGYWKSRRTDASGSGGLDLR